MADYDANRWLARQLAWENVLDRLREKAGVPLPEDPPSKRKPKRGPAAGGSSRNKAA
jgi:hypothetical protein